jgi:hypothetical protein
VVVWDFLLSIFWFMLLFAWIWLLISIVADIFRDHEMSGWGKALWCLFIMGVISEQEFAHAKAKLLGQQVSTTSASDQRATVS